MGLLFAKTNDNWAGLTYAGTFGTTTTIATLATVRENASGAGYFAVTGVLNSPTYDRSMHYKITVDGVIICNDLILITAKAGETVGATIIPPWFRFNTSYKVEHRLSATTATGYTTVLEAKE